MLSKMGCIVLSVLVAFAASVAPVACQQKDAAASPVEKHQPDVSACIEPGQKAAEEGKLDEALKIFSGCVAKFPDSAEANFLLGMALFLNKDTEKAATQFKKVMQLEPNSLQAAAMLGKLYSMERQKLGVARELLERVLSRAPFRDDVRFDLARVYAQQGEEKKCLAEFKILFNNEPKYSLYHTEFARILVAADRKADAITHLKRALALDPNFQPAKNMLESLEKEMKEAGSAADKGSKSQ